jgi:hypothetical protein
MNLGRRLEQIGARVMYTLEKGFLGVFLDVDGSVSRGNDTRTTANMANILNVE